ncbi:MAG: DUF6005 family protein [Arenicella sp.]
MQKSTALIAIYQILEQELHIPQISAFSETARLNEDLYLDSVLVMQLLVSLELELGLAVPDNALNQKDFATVGDLADFIIRQSNTSKTIEYTNVNQQTLEQTTDSQHSLQKQSPEQEFEDIKVHCFVSCICEIIKQDERVDHRPFYFGVWDAEIIIDDHACLAYHGQNINHDFFRHWYEKLYSVSITPWYDHNRSKDNNINTLLTHLENKTDSQHIMVMLDLYRLPERDNKFNQNPFPHYVLLEPTEDPESWFMSDPDFRWEGTMDKSQILYAIESTDVAGGYIFDSNSIRPSSQQAIQDYFLACFNDEHNPLTDSIRQVIAVHTGKDSRHIPENLDDALKQLPVLAIRKYAYEHGFAFFWRALQLNDNEFESLCDVIEELVSSYKQIQYRAIKIANQCRNGSSVDQTLLAEIYTLLNQQDEREFTIKFRLLEVFQQWQQTLKVPQQPFIPLLTQADMVAKA